MRCQDSAPVGKIVPVVLDAGLPERIGGPSERSLLSLPSGAGCLLDQLADRLASAVPGRVFILSDEFTKGKNGNGHAASQMRVGSIERLTTGRFMGMLPALEASDYLLIVDPRCWPASDNDFANVVGYSRGYRGATYAIAVGKPAGSAREQVDCTADGRIYRVQRLFSPMDWPPISDAALFCSLVPAPMVAQCTSLCLAGLRRELAARGVFTRDLPVPSDADDLTGEAGMLALSERTTERTVAFGRGRDLRVHSPGVLAAEGCRIHPSARLVGPVILQSQATVEEGAVIIGPTVIGPGGRVGRRAVVARSLLCSGAAIEAGSTVSRRVVAGRWSVSSEKSSEGTSFGRAGASAGIVGPARDFSDRAAYRAQEADKKFQFAVKRLIDVSISALGLLALLPLFLIVALLIKLTSKGPVFFMHRRETKGGREFPCIKFRTMVPDAHDRQRDLYAQSAVDGPQFKLENDPRVTPVGRLLRGTNIDELPQLINVLLGHMSLVGPRPSPFRENQICVPWRRARLSVRPGITGLWQMCRSEGGFHEWIFYDLAYVRDFSLWLDFKILLATIVTLGGWRKAPPAWLAFDSKGPGRDH